MQPNNLPVIQQYLAANPYKAPQAKPTPVNHGNFLTHLLPTIGGTGGGILGGAAGGALAGSAILPGVGTVAGGLLGALLGGYTGGTAGKVVENKVEGNKNLGQGALQQGLEQGVLSAGPLRLLKGAGAAGKALLSTGADQAAVDIGSNVAGQVATKAPSTLTNALNAAGDAASKPGLINKVFTGTQTGASSRTANGLGIGIGDKVGSQQLTPDASSSLQDFLTGRAKLYGGIQPGTPAQQAIDAQVVHNGVQTQLGTALKGIDRPVTQAEKNAVVSQLNHNVIGDASLTGNNAVMNNFQGQIQNAKTVSDLENIRMAADKLAYNKGGDLASSQAAAQAGHTRSAIDNFVTNMSPSGKINQAAIDNYKAIKGDYGASKDLLAATTGSAKDATGIKLPLPGNITLPAQTSAGIVNKANAGLDSLASHGASATANPFGAVGVASRDIPTGLVQALLGSQSNMANMTDNTQSPMNMPNSSNMDTSSQTNGDLSSQQQQSASPYSQENLVADIQRDPKNASQYINTYKSLDAIFNPTGDASLTTNQKNEVVSQQKAGDLLKQYTQNLSAAGGGQGPLKGALSSSVFGGYTDPAAHAMVPNRIEMAAAIAGALNPRGTVSPTVTAKVAEALPTITDTPGTVQNKLRLIQSMIAAGAYSGVTPVSQLAAQQSSDSTNAGYGQ